MINNLIEMKLLINGDDYYAYIESRPEDASSSSSLINKFRHCFKVFAVGNLLTVSSLFASTKAFVGTQPKQILHNSQFINL